MRYLLIIAALLLGLGSAHAQEKECETAGTILAKISEHAKANNYPVRSTTISDKGVDYFIVISPSRAVAWRLDGDGCANAYWHLDPAKVAPAYFKMGLAELFATDA